MSAEIYLNFGHRVAVSYRISILAAAVFLLRVIQNDSGEGRKGSLGLVARFMERL